MRKGYGPVFTATLRLHCTTLVQESHNADPMNFFAHNQQ